MPPKWRGASPVQQVLMNNEKESGFTFILMNERLDEWKDPQNLEAEIQIVFSCLKAF